jgi:hypothetical protein
LHPRAPIAQLFPSHPGFLLFADAFKHQPHLVVQGDHVALQTSTPNLGFFLRTVHLVLVSSIQDILSKQIPLPGFGLVFCFPHLVTSLPHILDYVVLVVHNPGVPKSATDLLDVNRIYIDRKIMDALNPAANAS